jgi:hypothetical protein
MTDEHPNKWRTKSRKRNENNLAMEEMPSSEDKPSLSQPMDGLDNMILIVMTRVTMMARNYERKSKYENVD